MAVPRLLAEHGVEADGILEASGLRSDALSYAEKQISFLGVARVLAEAVRQTRCPHFGLLVGRDWQLRDLGIVGELMRLSDTLGDAVHVGVTPQNLNSQGAAAFVFDYSQSESLGYVSFHRMPNKCHRCMTW